MGSEEMAELQRLSPGARELIEAGLRYVFMPQLRLPEGVAPEIVDGLLCLDSRDGYPTRLFFSQQVAVGGKGLNWNGTAHIAGRNWHAYSWKDVNGSLRPMQVFLGHLDALR